MARTLSQKNGFSLVLGALASPSAPAPSLEDECFCPRGGLGTFEPDGIGGGGRGAGPPLGGGGGGGPGFGGGGGALGAGAGAGGGRGAGGGGGGGGGPDGG